MQGALLKNFLLEACDLITDGLHAALILLQDRDGVTNLVS